MPKELYNLTNKTEDGLQYAPNFHKKVLDLIDKPPELRHVGPKPDSCCYCPVKLRLIYILSIDAIASFIHFFLFYILDNYEYFRKQEYHHTIRHVSQDIDGVNEVNEIDLDYIEILQFTNHTVVQTINQDFSDDEVEILKYESKFANSLQKYTDVIQQHCGETYFRNFLVGDSLQLTELIFNEFCQEIKYSSLAYLFFDLFYLFLVGVCSERSGGKVMLIGSWVLQFPPLFVLMNSVLLLQTKRLCILEFGMKIRFQTVTTIYLCAVILYFKCFQLLKSLSFYIMRIVQTKVFLTENQTANVYMSQPGPAYKRYFSEKEANLVPHTTHMEPGTYRVGVTEIPFGGSENPINLNEKLTTSQKTNSKKNKK